MIQPPIRSASGARGTTAPANNSFPVSARHWILIAEERAVNWEGRAPIQGTTSAQIVAVAFSPCLFSSRWPTTSHARATLLAEFWRTLRSRSATLLVDQF
ncbi:hypothetical protein CFRS1_v008125 [Colletotrichum fructicola]|nr:hypothetical protein CFRS1_v008125 [Colletotrichum fructicola]